MSATDTLPPLVPLSQKPTRIVKARPPNRPPPHLPPKPPQKLPPPVPRNDPPCAKSDLAGPRSDLVGPPKSEHTGPKNHAVMAPPRSGAEPPDNVGDNQPLTGICVKKIAGLFQKEPVGGASEESQPRGPPKPTGGLGREEKVLPQKEENRECLQDEAELKEAEGDPCPPREYFIGH
uniref:Uncharacterized protein n=1 Tax=Xenopus tropicalis TaxID=8364 RepID=A0A1B8XVM6_XENTR